jgi:hypothetical protein
VSGGRKGRKPILALARDGQSHVTPLSLGLGICCCQTSAVSSMWSAPIRETVRERERRELRGGG